MSRPDAQPGPESEPNLTQRQFLKRLVGSAAGVAGLAVAGNLLNPATAEAAYIPGGAVAPLPDPPFPAPFTTGDRVDTNLQIDRHLAVKGHRPWADVTAFGALGMWGQWADSYVQTAINSLPAEGGLVYFPPGNYVFQGPITCVNKHITLAGAGVGVTLLYWANNGGLHITAQGYKVTIRDMFLMTGMVNSAPAITIVGAWPTMGTATPRIHDVCIHRHPTIAASGFAKGIELYECSGATIDRFEIVGGQGSTIGIHLIGNPALPGGSSIVNICSGLILNHTTGVQVSANCEGTYLRGVEVVDAEVGYKFESPKPGSAISDCHAATTKHGVHIVDHGDLSISGNLFYGKGDDPGGWTGIYAKGTGGQGGALRAGRLRIIGNAITTLGGGTSRIGMYLEDFVTDCTIQGNVINRNGGNLINFGIIFAGAGWTNNIVMGNRLDAITPLIPAVAPPGSLFVNNL